MSIATIITRIVDGLWAAGGICAAAELGCEDFGSHLARPALAPRAFTHAGVRGSRRTVEARLAAAPLLEGELCRNPVVRKSPR